MTGQLIRWLPLLLALTLGTLSYFVKKRQETSVGYTFSWLDWGCLEFPLAAVSVIYGGFAAMKPNSVLVKSSVTWWIGSMVCRLLYYAIPLSMGLHGALTIMTWGFSVVCWMETSTRKVWHQPVTHRERHSVYWPIGLSVAVTSGHVGECISAFLAWKRYGHVATIIIVLMIVVTLLHMGATCRFGNNLGFLVGTVWETSVLLSASLGDAHPNIRITAACCAGMTILTGLIVQFMDHRRLHRIPLEVIAYHAKKKQEAECACPPSTTTVKSTTVLMTAPGNSPHPASLRPRQTVGPHGPKSPHARVRRRVVGVTSASSPPPPRTAAAAGHLMAAAAAGKVPTHLPNFVGASSSAAVAPRVRRTTRSRSPYRISRQN